jgi:hypothetical protein
LRLQKNPDLPIAWVTPSKIQVGIDTQDSFQVENVSALTQFVLQEADGFKKFSEIEVSAVADLLKSQVLLNADSKKSDFNFADLKIGIFSDQEYANIFERVFITLGFDRVSLRKSDPTFAQLDFAVVFNFMPLILNYNHLLINFVGESILIGPLVVPGKTSCLNCLFLHRVDINTLWPAIALSFDYSKPRTTLLNSQLAASHAVGAISNFLTQQKRGLQNQILEINPKNSFFQLRELKLHPKCGCKW